MATVAEVEAAEATEAIEATETETVEVPHLGDYVLMADAAEYLGLTRQAVHKMIRTGRLGDGVRVVGDSRPTFLIPRAALVAEVARRHPTTEDLARLAADGAGHGEAGGRSAA